MFGRQRVAALVAEFLGTGVLALLIATVQRATGAQFYVGIAAGVAFAALTLVFAAVSGAHFNPVITLGHVIARRISVIMAVLYVVVQMLGGWAAFGVYNYFAKTDLQPIGGHYEASIMLAEALGTMILALGVAAAIYQRYSAGVTAAVNGLAYMLGIVVASTAAIGMLNPAVALGADSWVWKVYLLGPVIGGLVGFLLYHFLFAPSTAVVVSETVVVESVAAVPAATTSRKVAKPAAKKTVKAVKAPKAKATTRRKK